VGNKLVIKTADILQGVQYFDFTKTHCATSGAEKLKPVLCLPGFSSQSPRQWLSSASSKR
jgi:hypothetical protein